MPSAGANLTTTLIRTLRLRWRFIAARALRVSRTLTLNRPGAGSVRRPVPVEVVRRPTRSRRAVLRSTLEAAASRPLLLLRANTASRPVRSTDRIRVVLRLSRSDVAGVGVGVGVTVGEGVGDAVGDGVGVGVGSGSGSAGGHGVNEGGGSAGASSGVVAVAVRV